VPAPLGRSFFERSPEVVACELVGALLVVRAGATTCVARLVETEAYGGADDPASHSFRGPTPRSAVMFGPAGHLYVYRSYGLHWCANVVTGPPGVPGAVLLRAAEVLEGPVARALLSGPGILTRELALTGEDNGSDCCSTRGRVSFANGPRDAPPMAVAATPRVGISREMERPWRFVALGHPAASRRASSRGPVEE
jgi:DNA-3-methyladenine glycosylase